MRPEDELHPFEDTFELRPMGTDGAVLLVNVLLLVVLVFLLVVVVAIASFDGPARVAVAVVTLMGGPALGWVTWRAVAPHVLPVRVVVRHGGVQLGDGFVDRADIHGVRVLDRGRLRIVVETADGPWTSPALGDDPAHVERVAAAIRTLVEASRAPSVQRVPSAMTIR
ncbi:MAG: hypothetical protein H6736_20625 [Alphaproteobacteria bacterium]|nr:hypothetical protein [Alphaproteobacteria bacterium]